MNSILQLGLNRRRKTDSTDAFVTAIWMIERLLDLISEKVTDGDETRTESFLQELEPAKSDILKSAWNRVDTSSANNALDLCRNQFDATQKIRAERDLNFTDIILFLRKSIRMLSGDSRNYNDSLMDTVERIGNLSDIRDIKELKDKISAEVMELNRIVKEKQERERIQYAELSEEINQLQDKLVKAESEASIDGLTGIANRRYFDSMIQQWIQSHTKSEESFIIALFDLDNFKQVNDTYGHQAGDQVLAHIAHQLEENIRATDFLARYGGEEFVILCEGMELKESEKKFSDVLAQISSCSIPCQDSQEMSCDLVLTASCGVAAYALGESANDLIQRADDALYDAKSQGKNRVVAKRRSLMSAYYEGRRTNTAL